MPKNSTWRAAWTVGSQATFAPKPIAARIAEGLSPPTV